MVSNLESDGIKKNYFQFEFLIQTNRKTNILNAG